jgi:hypothetical protein
VLQGVSEAGTGGFENDAVGRGSSYSTSRSKSASSSKSFSSNWTAWRHTSKSFDAGEVSRVRSIMLEVSWKESCLLKTEESLEEDGAINDSAFFFRPWLIFGDLVPSVLEELVKPVKPPIDCVDWRTLLNCSFILPSWAGLLEGNSCFARSILGAGASYSLAARLNIAPAIDEDVHLWPGASKFARCVERGRGAFR